MILHRRIHKFAVGKFDEGVTLAKELNRIGQEKLNGRSRMYVSSIWGGSQPRPRLIVDTEHDSLAAMEAYYTQFFGLSEVQALISQWQAIEEESWGENYILLTE